MNEPKKKIRLSLSAQGQRYANPDAPLDARRMAARGAMPLPPVELATVLFALLHDEDAEVKDIARRSLEQLPEDVCAAVLSGPAHPAVLSYLGRLFQNSATLMEKLALNAHADDATSIFLAGLTHKAVVDIIANNQQRLLRCPEIVDALGENPLVGCSVIDRILGFLGLSRPAAEVSDEPDDDLLPNPDEISDDAAMAALKAILGDDADGFARELIEDEAFDENSNLNLSAMVQQMNVMQKIKLARMGNKEARGLLLRDTNKIVAVAAVRSPKITENEVEQIAKMRNVTEEVLRVVASNREWTKKYPVKLALATNPKVAQPTSMRFLNYLHERDLRLVMKSKDVPSAVATHARRLLTKKGKL